jgi:putative virulence related protein PagC
MKIKMIVTALVITGSVLLSPVVMAQQQTVSMGYAYARLNDIAGLNGINVQYQGINLQYRYEWDSPLSIIGSFSYMKGDKSVAYHDAWGDAYKISADAKYYSLLAGPAYRLNDYLSLYGLLGVAYSKINGSYQWRNSVGADEPDGHLNIHASRHTASLAYAAGVAINPINNLSINLGYEGASVDFYGSKKSLNGFNVGIGWRF